MFDATTDPDVFRLLADLRAVRDRAKMIDDKYSYKLGNAIAGRFWHLLPGLDKAIGAVQKEACYVCDFCDEYVAEPGVENHPACVAADQPGPDRGGFDTPEGQQFFAQAMGYGRK